jgi:hypothetical protein
MLRKPHWHALAVLAITVLAFGLRMYAAARLNVDYDEPVYLSAAVSYARYMRLGDLKMLAWNEHTYEHPALYKILYGAALLTQQPLDRLPDKDLPRQTPIASTAAGPWNMAARYMSVAWGTLAVLALSLLDPAAGFFMAVNTLSVKYTSEVYLEALPVFASLLSVLAYSRWFEDASKESAPSGRHGPWLAASAALLGVAVASKYVYGVAGLAIAVHFLIALLRRQVTLRHARYMLVWAPLALFCFFAFDPYLWPHPIARLLKSVSFHEAYGQSSWVAHYHYPFWQPFRWLAAFSTFYDLQPASAFLLNIDAPMFVLALVGLPSLFQRRPVFFWWIIIGVAFLLAWQTKWPQYTLIVMAPLSLSASVGAQALGRSAWRALRRQAPVSRSS